MTYLSKLVEMGYKASFRVMTENFEGVPSCGAKPPTERWGMVRDVQRMPGYWVECYAEGKGRVLACKVHASADDLRGQLEGPLVKPFAEFCFAFLLEEVVRLELARP